MLRHAVSDDSRIPFIYGWEYVKESNANYAIPYDRKAQIALLVAKSPLQALRGYAASTEGLLR